MAQPGRHLEAHDGQVRGYIADHEHAAKAHQQPRVVPEQHRRHHGQQRESQEIRRGAVVAHQHPAGLVIVKNASDNAAIDELMEVQSISHAGRYATHRLAVDGKDRFPHRVNQQQHGEPR